MRGMSDEERRAAYLEQHPPVCVVCGLQMKPSGLIVTVMLGVYRCVPCQEARGEPCPPGRTLEDYLAGRLDHLFPERP